MEYAIYSHTRRIEDYVLAIEYEVNLETLRKMRKRRLGRYLGSEINCRIVKTTNKRLSHSTTNSFYF